MAEVGTYYITIMPDMSKFTGNVKSALGSVGKTDGKTYSSSFIDTLKGSAIGTALGNLAMEAGRSIMGGLNTGIGRLDTIKNFPKVMDALGFSADDAQASIGLIMQQLDGLPTATQDVVSMTQAFADSTGDLELATRAALGFNDMMLASGASAGEVTQAQGVLNRVLGKGNATVAQWQSLQSVMPAQLAAVARELGGEGMSVEELRDKLNDGTISWDEFLQAVVRLDEEGSGSMASFRDQAIANSTGIGTALQNVENRIGAGWASILDAFGQENISSVIDDVSYGIRDAMERIGDAITFVKDLVADTAIADNLQRLGDGLSTAFSNFFSDGPSLEDFTTAAVDLIDNVLQWMADNSGVVAAALMAIAGGFAAIVGWNLGVALAGIPGAISAIWTAISLNPIGAIITLVAALILAVVGFFRYTEQGQAIIQAVGDGLKAFWQGLVDLWNNLKQNFADGIAQIKQKLEESGAQWEVFKQNVADAWERIKDVIKMVVDKIKTTVAKAFNAVKETVKTVTTAIKTTVTNVWNGIKTTTTNVFNGVKTTVQNVWDAIKNAVSTAANAVKTTVTNIFNAVKTTVTNIWNGIKSAVTNAVNGVRSTVSSVFSAVSGTVSSIWNGIRSTISNAINSAKNAVDTAVNTIKSLISNARPTFPSIKAPDMSAAKNAVSRAVQAIKDTINNMKVSWKIPSMPHIPTPHFSVSWKEILGGIVKIPTVKFNGWYASGGYFDSPSLIGVGEAGPEAVLPLNAGVYRRIAQGIVSEGAGGVTVTGNTFYVREEADIDRIASALARRIRREGASAA